MEIKGKNIRLEEISESDTDDIIRWRNHVRNNFIDRNLFNVESHTKWLNEIVRKGKAVQFIIDTEAYGRIGSVFLRDIDYKNGKAEYGIFIGEDAALGKGYGTEAAGLIIKYGFDDLKLHKIMLRVFAFNNGAIRSYEKAGFVREGYLRDEVCIDGKYYDIVLMGIIKGDSDE